MKSDTLRRTPLYGVHERLGAKLVEFAGFLMPLSYEGVLEEHRCVRRKVGLFDISHMGEFEIGGRDALALLQRMTHNDVARLEVYQAQYSGMCYPDGGMVDDVVLYRYPGHYMMVVNAANIEKDFEWLSSHLSGDVELIDRSDDIALLALQGPLSEETLAPLTPTDLSAIAFYHFIEGTVADLPVVISRTGYTGEPGFELYIEGSMAPDLWDALMESGAENEIRPVGLGARDTLRLEMRYCLYGNDIDETTSPLEAALGWTVKVDKGDFVGRDAIVRMKEAGIPRKLVAFTMSERAIPRHGYVIHANGVKVGTVTSGSFSPMLSSGIGMGYVKTEHSAPDTEITIDIRGRAAPAVIVKPPIYKGGLHTEKAKS